MDIKIHRQKKVDEECNRKDAKWLGEYKIYLTDSFLVSIYSGLTAIDIDTVSSVILYDEKQESGIKRIMDARKTDGSVVKIYENISKDKFIFEEEKDYLEMIFGSKNISFICETEVQDELEYEEYFE